MGGRVAQRRRAVGRVQQRAAGSAARSGGAQAAKRASCSPKKASPRSSAVAKWVISAGELARPAPPRRRSATRVASAGSRVPRRPMPVSSLTWTPTAAGARAATASTKPSRQATTSAPARQRDVSSSALSAPMTSTRPSTPARAQLARPPRRWPPRATPRRRPAAARAAGTRAVAVAVGLDDRAQLARPARSRAAGARRCARSPPRSTRARARTGIAVASPPRRQRLEDVDARDDADQAPVARRPAGGCGRARRSARPASCDRRVGRDRDRVARSSGRATVAGDRLAQALLEVPQRLEEDDAAEELDVVREVRGPPCSSESTRSFSVTIPTSAPRVVDDREAGQLVLAQQPDDRLDASSSGPRSRARASMMSPNDHGGEPYRSARRAPRPRAARRRRRRP